VRRYLRDPMFIRFDTILECARQTDRHTDTRRRHIPRLAVSRGKNDRLIGGVAAYAWNITLAWVLVFLSYPILSFFVPPNFAGILRLNVEPMFTLFASYDVSSGLLQGFIHSSRTVVGRWQSFGVPFSLTPALRPRHGPVRNSPLTLGLELYVYRA